MNRENTPGRVGGALPYTVQAIMDGETLESLSVAPPPSHSASRPDPYEPPPPDSTDRARFIHALTDEHLGVMVDIVCLEREAEALVARGRAGAIIGRVAVELCAVRDAAGAVVLDASEPNLSGLFEPDAPLGVYLTGLLMWTRAVVKAVRVMGASMELEPRSQPPWLATRQRLDEASGMHLAGLADDSLSHVEQLCRDEPANEDRVMFQRQLRSLVAAAEKLSRTLRESFALTPAV
jgi:hypothetical protein